MKKIVESKSCCARRNADAVEEYEEKNEYEENMKLVMFVLKAFGTFPVFRSHEGSWHFFFRSWAFIYSLIVYSLLMAASVISYMKYVDYYFSRDEKRRFYDYLDVVWCIFQKLPFLTIPLVIWPESRNVPPYLHRWKNVLKRFRLSGVDISLSHLYRSSLFWIIVIFVLEICKEVVEYVVLKWTWTFNSMAILHYISYFVPGVLNQILVLFLCLSCKAISTAGKTLSLNFQQAMLDSPSAVQIINHYHSLWLDLCMVCRNFGNTFCNTYLFCFLCTFTLDITGIYFIISINEVKITTGWALVFLVDTVVFNALIFFSCVSGHEVKISVGYDFQQILLSALIGGKNSSSKEELNMFLTTVQTCPPEINFGGYFTLNRRLIVSICTTMVTYLVIIVQFDISANNDMASVRNDSIH